jgi:hypothetical protein
VARSGIISTVAGGNASPAEARRHVSLNQPLGVQALHDGGFIVADSGHNRVLVINRKGRIAADIGGGAGGYGGDGQQAREASLRNPNAAAVGPDGTIIIADTDNEVVRFVAPPGSRRLGLALVPRDLIAPLGGCAQVELVATRNSAAVLGLVARRQNRTSHVRLRANHPAQQVLCRGPGTYLVRATARDGEKIAGALGRIIIRR